MNNSNVAIISSMHVAFRLNEFVQCLETHDPQLSQQHNCFFCKQKGKISFDEVI